MLQPMTPVMQETAGEPEDAGVCVQSLLADLESGTRRFGRLAAEERRQCIAHLTDEGHSAAAIAARLGIGERTVTRERAAIRREGALSADAATGPELLGEFQRLTLQSIGRLVRLAHDPQSPPYVRLWAEEAIARNYKRFVEAAHRLGYVPQPPPEDQAADAELDPRRVAEIRQIYAVTGASAMYRENPTPENLKALNDACAQDVNVDPATGQPWG